MALGLGKLTISTLQQTNRQGKPMASIPKDLLRAVTSNAHFRVAVALYELADSKGFVHKSTKELAAHIGVSESTLTRAFRDLESKNYLETQRIRKGFNKFSYNIYRVTIESSELESQTIPSPVTMSNTSTPAMISLSLKDEQSTADMVTNKYLVSQVSNKGKEILRISSPTGRLPHRETNIEGKPGSVVSPGLDSTIPASLNPKDFRTRGRRPVESWTHWDVAAEFAYLLQRRYPDVPLLIDKKRLAKALLPMRANYGSTAAIEMKLVEWFFDDRYKLRVAESQPHKIIGTFLNTFKTDLEKARRAVESDMENEGRSEFVYASDGKAFDNSIPGRRRLERYEEKLAATIEVETPLMALA